MICFHWYTFLLFYVAMGFVGGYCGIGFYKSWIRKAHEDMQGAGMNTDYRFSIAAAVQVAMDKQKRKFGHEPLATRFEYASILGEEFGEICRGVNQNNRELTRHESIQSIAVIMAYLEGDLHYGDEK